MKLNYKNQMNLTIVIIIVMNGLNMLLKHWIFSSLGKVMCGMLWLVHPVLLDSAEVTKRNLGIVRLAGVVLILWGFMSRLYLY